MRHALRVLLLLVLLAPTPSRATGSGASPPPTAAEPGSPPATLRLFNRDIVTFRVAYFGVHPADRAAAGVTRIYDVLARGGPGVVAMVPRGAEGLFVTVDGVYAFRILSGDLDADDGQTFEQARVVVGKRLEEAIAAARVSMRGRRLVSAVGRSAAATLALGLVMWGLIRARRWARRRIDASLARRRALGLEERAAILWLIRSAGHIATLVVVAILAEEWLRFVLDLFPYTQPWAQGLTGYLGRLLAQAGAAVVGAVPGLAMVAVIAGLAHVATRLVQALARGIERGRYTLFGIDAEVVHPARRLAIAALWLFALAMAYPYIPGSSSEAFKGLSVLVGVMVSLGASGVVGQVAGGLILTFSRALRHGEWVRIGEVEGAVMTVGTFSTRIRTYTDEEVSIPNQVVLATVTRNFSRPAAAEGSVLTTSVTIGYGTPWRQVHAMLLEAAARTAQLDREPPPDVLQTALSDYYVEYVLRVRLRDRLQRPAVLSALNANVQDVFNAYGVQIMSPHYIADPPAPVVVPRVRWFEPPAAPPGDARPAGSGPSPDR